MPWNWPQAGWPDFIYDFSAVDDLERRFLQSSGELVGAVRHFSGDEANLLKIEILSEEAVKTSEIEGEMQFAIAMIKSRLPFRRKGP